MNQYDVVVIGSGIGGLVCANILAKEGYSVCVLEKNKQVGGSLQTFSRDKVIFDSGVHYVGGLDEGQNLNKIFRYLGILDKLKLQRMDMDGFDHILIGDDPVVYKQAQGYENFIQQLVAHFPEEENAIRAYCDKMKEVCRKFPLYNLRTKGLYEEKIEVLGINAMDFIKSVTANEKLQAVLMGNNALYVGVAEETPFYVHALVVNSYIESAWKCIDGGSQIAKILTRSLREKGGEVIRHCDVKALQVENGQVVSAETRDGRLFRGKMYVSNVHPAKTMDMLQTDVIRKAYRKRLQSLDNTASSFLVHVVFKKNSFPYVKHNYYYHKAGEIWNMSDYTEDNWPLGYAIFMPPSSRSPEYAEAMTVFAYMRYAEVAPWQHTHNTVSEEEDRGESYAAFKKYKAEILLEEVEKRFPGIRSCIHSYTASTPLTYRDYIGNYDGSLYGIAKDSRDPLKTFISPRTKVENLYLTGQNINLHGVLGCTISALLTCITILGTDDIVEKIRNA